MKVKEHEAWFATLKAGDAVACRMIGGYSFGPWRRRTIQRSTGSTVWLAPTHHYQQADKVSPRSRKLEIRPWTAEDQQGADAEAADNRIRSWVETHIRQAAWASKPLDPRVRAAMLTAIASVDGAAP